MKRVSRGSGEDRKRVSRRDMSGKVMKRVSREDMLERTGRESAGGQERTGRESAGGTCQERS